MCNGRYMAFGLADDTLYIPPTAPQTTPTNARLPDAVAHPIARHQLTRRQGGRLSLALRMPGAARLAWQRRQRQPGQHRVAHGADAAADKRTSPLAGVVQRVRKAAPRKHAALMKHRQRQRLAVAGIAAFSVKPMQGLTAQHPPGFAA